MATLSPVPTYTIPSLDPRSRLRLVDTATNGVVYHGEAIIPDAATSDRAWKIRRITLSGAVTTEETALDGNFLCRWDDRATYFGPAPNLFTNIYSTMFDGVNDRGVIGNNIFNFERTDTFSISLWMKTTVLSGGRNILGNATSATAATRGWNIRLNANQLEFMIGNSGTNAIRVQLAAGVIITNTWHHVVVTYDGSSSVAGVTVYVDGTPRALTTVLNTLNATTVVTSGVTTLGAITGGGSGFYQGFLDEIAITNNVLSGAEVMAVYNGGSPADLSLQPFYSSNVQSWWRMGDEATYPVVADQKGVDPFTLLNGSQADFVTDVP